MASDDELVPSEQAEAAEAELIDVAAGKRPFDPSRHLRQLRGRSGTDGYLDVKWRLVWLRSEHPDAVITTEHVTITSDLAVFKCSVSIPGGGSASGYGSETAGDFGDFLEKAETKAVGRALIALGYGTVLSEGDDPELAGRGGGRGVEVEYTRPNGQGQRQQAPKQQRSEPASKQKLVKINALLDSLLLTDDELAAVKQRAGVGDLTAMSDKEAGRLIYQLQELADRKGGGEA